MREGRKFVTETYGVRASNRRHERVTVELRLYLSVKYFFGRRLDDHVDVVLTTGDDLTRALRSITTKRVNAEGLTFSFEHVPDIPTSSTCSSRCSRSNNPSICPGARKSIRSCSLGTLGTKLVTVRTTSNYTTVSFRLLLTGRDRWNVIHLSNSTRFGHPVCPERSVSNVLRRDNCNATDKCVI